MVAVLSVARAMRVSFSRSAHAAPGSIVKTLSRVIPAVTVMAALSTLVIEGMDISIQSEVTLRRSSASTCASWVAMLPIESE